MASLSRDMGMKYDKTTACSRDEDEDWIIWLCRFRRLAHMALKIDIIQVATAMHELAKAVRAVHVRISIDDMFALTLQAAAGPTGCT